MRIADRWFALVLTIAFCLRAHAEIAIFWTETRFDSAFVMRATADGSTPHAIVSGNGVIQGPNGLEYGNGYLFWPDQQLNVISRARPDGSEAGAFAVATNAYDVVVGSERVYWSSLTGHRIDSTKLDGTDPQVYSKRLQPPFAVELAGTNLFWSVVLANASAGSVQHAATAGGGAGAAAFNCVVYDMQLVGSILYYGDNLTPGGIKKIDTSKEPDTTGADVTTILPVPFLNGLCVTQDAIYWSDLESIHRAGLNGENPVTLYTAPAGGQVRGVVVLDDAATSAGIQLSTPQRDGNNLVFSVQGGVGKTVHVEESQAAMSGAWSEVSTFQGAPAPTTVTQPIQSARDATFFRARSD